MLALRKRLSEPSTHAALAAAALTVLPALGVPQEITTGLSGLLALFGVALPERRF